MKTLKALVAVALFGGALASSQLEDTSAAIGAAAEEAETAADEGSTASTGGCPCTRPACWPYCRSAP
jgi:hypothetical protein